MSSLNQIKSRPKSRDCQRGIAPPLAGVFSIKRGGLPLRISKSLLLLPLAILTLLSCEYLFDITPPNIEIIEPQEGVSYFNTLPCELEVTDNYKVAKVEVFLDDASVHEFTQEPYTKEIALGGISAKALKVVAHDRAGNWADEQREVRVLKESSTYNSTDVPKSISDYATITSTIIITDNGTIADINVGVSITHTFDGDLDIYLISPVGTRIELSTDNGSGGGDYNSTVFDDEASTSIINGTPPFSGSYQPEGVLSNLGGESMTGTWTLEIYDDGLSDRGTLTAWHLVITPQ